MNENRSIPERLQDQLESMRESSYGIVRIRVTLDDGTRFSDVLVAWGSEIVKVGAAEDIPFDPARIVSVEQQ